MTESISRSEAPDRINGAPEIGKSMPPRQSTGPPPFRHQLVIDRTAANRREPTVSIPSLSAHLPMVSRVRRASRNSMMALALPFFQLVGRLCAAGRGCDLKATPRENCSCERADGPDDENRRRGGCDPAADFGNTAA
ncbi:MAG TPA: hypothetical protein VFJ46_21030 [Xanthobacteraceae bacterium]|nr:hypothetical protein [Xanthobacteraceae bacterium]